MVICVILEIKMPINKSPCSPPGIANKLGLVLHLYDVRPRPTQTRTQWSEHGMVAAGGALGLLLLLGRPSESRDGEQKTAKLSIS